MSAPRFSIRPRPASRAPRPLTLLAVLGALLLAAGPASATLRPGSDAPPASGSRAVAPAGTSAPAVARPQPAGEAAIRTRAAGSFAQRPAAERWGFAARALLAVLVLPAVLWWLRRPRPANRIESPGFEVISPTEPRRFIPLEDRFQALDFLSRLETLGQLRLSANLNKVTLSIRRFGYLMEDKNYRNALLVNRRRVRRTLLRDGDVLDLGDLTLLYRDNRAARVQRFSSVTPPEGKSQIKFARAKGPVRRGMPMLVSEQSPGRIFYVTKNKVYIGRSESNDLVIKSRNVYYRHAKLERVGGRWKLQDLSILGNTLVNNRRIEQRFLKEGDEIAIESHRFRFSLVTRAMRERPPQPEAAEAEESEETTEASAGEPEAADLSEGPEGPDGPDEMDEAASS